MKPADRKIAIEKNMADRKALNDRMAELVKKRDRYVMEKRSKEPAGRTDSFDSAVADTLKAQIKR
jgi:hypothetical protein